MISENRRKTIFRLIFLAALLLAGFTAVKVFNVINIYKGEALGEFLKEGRTAQGVFLFLAALTWKIDTAWFRKILSFIVFGIQPIFLFRVFYKKGLYPKIP
jgi:hypothetical protein